LLPGCSTLVSVTTANVFLDGIERGNVFERFAGDRRRAGSCKLVEATATGPIPVITSRSGK
jgi:hypothetical protein